MCSLVACACVAFVFAVNVYLLAFLVAFALVSLGAVISDAAVVVLVALAVAVAGNDDGGDGEEGR